jgi:hypothetical protein
MPENLGQKDSQNLSKFVQDNVEFYVKGANGCQKGQYGVKTGVKLMLADVYRL